MICLSALLTTTIIAQKEVVDALQEMGHKEDFKVMIGGAASSRNWAEEIGADAYGADAQDAVEVAIDLLKK